MNAMKTIGRKAPLSLVVLSLLIMGCAGTPLGPEFTEVGQIPEGKGLIYIYRPSLPYEFGVAFEVKANDVPVVSIRDGSYYPYFSTLGRVVLSSKRTGEETGSLVLTVRNNEVYCVKLIPVRGVFRFKPVLTLESKATAEGEIAPTRLIQ